MKNCFAFLLLLVTLDCFSEIAESPRLRLVGPRIPLADQQRRHIWPSGALNPITKQFLVPWTQEWDRKQRVRGRFVNLDDFSFRKQILYSPADKLGLLIWESSKANGSDIRYIYSRRFRLEN
jgi:hypothetical protein